MPFAICKAPAAEGGGRGRRELHSRRDDRALAAGGGGTSSLAPARPRGSRRPAVAEVTPEADALAAKYIERGALTQRMLPDALARPSRCSGEQFQARREFATHQDAWRSTRDGIRPAGHSKPEGGSNMTTTREKQGFDCVKTTREIRDRLGVELAGMSPEDRVQWLNTRDFSDPLLRRLVNRRRSQEGRGGESAPARSTGSPVPDAIPSVSRQEVSDDEHRLQA